MAAALGAPTSVKNIQLTFGYPPYAGRPTVHSGPPGYYTLSTKVRGWLHYNGLFTTAIIVDSGTWDAVVARIMDSPDKWKFAKEVSRLIEEQAEKVAFGAQVQKEIIEAWDDSDYADMKVGRAQLEEDLKYSTTILPRSERKAKGKG